MSASTPTAASDYQLLHIHDSRVPEIVVSLAVCLPAAYIAVILRFISRRIGKVQLKADDWWLVAGLIFTTGFVACDAVATHLGLGRPAIFIRHPVTFAKIVVAKEFLYNPAIVAIKTSILLLYRRIFTQRSFNTSFEVILWCTDAFVLAYSLCQAVLTVFHCTPVEALWNPTVEAKCINFDQVLIVLSSLNIGTDILILCLPMPQLWKLNMPKGPKCQLMGIFLLGGFVCVASVIRVPYIAHISLVDPSWSDVYGSIWSIVELNLGIVSACLPTLRPLFRHAFRGDHPAVGPGNQMAVKKPRMSTEDGLSDNIPMTKDIDETPMVVLIA